MEWMWIPGVLTAAALFALVIADLRRPDGSFGILDCVSFILCAMALTAWIASPIIYEVDGRNDALAYAAYYDNVILPLVTEEHDDYVVIDSFKAGTWNEGVIVLQEYNAYLAVNRYWDQHWLWGTFVYPAPDYLKPVRVAP